MLVERIWTGNAYRNFNYLIACPQTGEALAIDPLDSEKTLATARVKGWQITQILNTHEHHDHTGGNEAVVAATGAKVIAHHKAGGKIRNMARGVQAGDVILTSYGTLARDLAYHLKRDYRAVVVDEASLMRNPDTDHAKALAKLRATCRRQRTQQLVERGRQAALLERHAAQLADRGARFLARAAQHRLHPLGRSPSRRRPYC